jgi:tRNA modification GTPase
LDVWIVGSKKDLSQAEQRRAIEESAGPRFNGWVSPLTGEGVSELRERVVAGSARPVAQGEAVVVRQRHVQALAGAHRALERVLSSLGTMTHDVLCMDIEEAARNLGSILGRDVDAAVLDRIFSEFCLGK